MNNSNPQRGAGLNEQLVSIQYLLESEIRRQKRIRIENIVLIITGWVIATAIYILIVFEMTHTPKNLVDHVTPDKENMTFIALIQNNRQETDFAQPYSSVPDRRRKYLQHYSCTLTRYTCSGSNHVLWRRA